MHGNSSLPPRPPHSLPFIFVLFALFASPSTGASGPDFNVAALQDQASIRWASDPADPYKVVVEVYSLSADAIERLRRSKPSPARWQRLLSVYVGQEGRMSASRLASDGGRLSSRSERAALRAAVPAGAWA